MFSSHVPSHKMFIGYLPIERGVSHVVKCIIVNFLVIEKKIRMIRLLYTSVELITAKSCFGRVMAGFTFNSLSNAVTCIIF